MKLNRKADREPVAIETHLAGATFPNPDGSSRQDALDRAVKSRMPIECVLRREPGNKFDENAIAVYLPGGETQIGYVPAPRAQVLAFEMDRDPPMVKIVCFITSISPKNHNGNRGAELRIVVEDL